MITFRLTPRLNRLAMLAVAVFLGASLGSARVLDDFNDNTKTGWTDFTFQAGFGIPTETGGQFRFEQPPAGRPIFSASQKVSEVFELKDGRTIEFRVDVAQGGAKDSFAVLAFIPTANSPGTLAGYGLAKSTTDVLITKGIGNYFVNDATNLKQDNTTLVLRLTARDGSVVIHGQVLDKDDNNAVIWEQTVVDTPAADVMRNGTDTPAAPFLTGGYFTLYLYQDFDAGAPENPYRTWYDNAEVFVTDTTVLDDFNDNTKTGWTDFTFQPGFGIPVETGGQFRFEQPPAGRPIFSASQKVTRVIELRDGDEISFQVDIIEGGGKDSFAVLAFIPTANSPGTLAGYGLAKSTTDALITKGIGNYFVNDATNLKQDNTTLVLRLTARGGSVVIQGQVLDKDDNNAVIWEKTVADTPAADVMRNGTDTPAAPFLTSGYFTLYLYQDFDAGAPENPYRAWYDNAIVSAPPVAANLPPVITEIAPEEFRNFLPASTRISFKASDDKPLANDKLAIVLNGTRYTVANGLTVSGTGNVLTASVGGLAANQNYTALIEVEDADGDKTAATLDFDTFDPNTLVIEIEDYNFEGGGYYDNPVPIAEGWGPWPNSYCNMEGMRDVDFQDTRPGPSGGNSPWRNFDPVRMARSLDYVRAKYTAAGGAESDVYDYVVGDIAAGEWLNFTRTFPPGNYEVYLRQSVVNITTAESVLELVTGDRTQPEQTTQVLGSFLAPQNGYKYRNTPLTDGAGLNKVILRLNGVTTLRLRQVTPDGAGGSRTQNYLAFIPVADPGIQRATVTSLSPANNAVAQTVEPRIEVVIQNRDTAVDPGSVRLLVNGTQVTPVVTPTATGATVTYAYPTLPPKGAAQAARIIFADNQAFEQTNDWSFTVTYLELDPATRYAGPGPERGLRVRVVQAPPEGGLLENSLSRAESQLAANSSIPKAYDLTQTRPVINFSQNAPFGSAGYFGDDLEIPGASEEFGTDNYAMEALAFVELPAGIVRFGVRSDDGYKLATAVMPTAATPPLEFHNGGPADEVFDVVVHQAGVYAFRLVWYERGGDAHVEWFTVNRTSGERTLVNADAPGAVRAFTSALQPQLKLQAAEAVTGPYADDPAATINEQTRTITTTASGATRFYRLVGGAELRFKTVSVQGTLVTLTYE
jgi:hypothetical protein